MITGAVKMPVYTTALNPRHQRPLENEGGFIQIIFKDGTEYFTLANLNEERLATVFGNIVCDTNITFFENLALRLKKETFGKCEILYRDDCNEYQLRINNNNYPLKPRTGQVIVDSRNKNHNYYLFPFVCDTLSLTELCNLVAEINPTAKTWLMIDNFLYSSYKYVMDFSSLRLGDHGAQDKFQQAFFTATKGALKGNLEAYEALYSFPNLVLGHEDSFYNWDDSDRKRRFNKDTEQLCTAIKALENLIREGRDPIICGKVFMGATFVDAFERVSSLASSPIQGALSIHCLLDIVGDLYGRNSQYHVVNINELINNKSSRINNIAGDRIGSTLYREEATKALFSLCISSSAECKTSIGRSRHASFNANNFGHRSAVNEPRNSQPSDLSI